MRPYRFALKRGLEKRQSVLWALGLSAGRFRQMYRTNLNRRAGADPKGRICASPPYFTGLRQSVPMKQGVLKSLDAWIVSGCWKLKGKFVLKQEPAATPPASE
jgi:hypothetical protein